MRSWSLLCAIALAAIPLVIRVDVARADGTPATVAPTPAAQAAQPSAVPAGDVAEDPLAEFEGSDPMAPTQEPKAAEAGSDEMAPAAVAGESEGSAAAETPDPIPTETATPAEAATGDAAPAPAAVTKTATTRHHQVELGPLGVDPQGRQGRIHTVAGGDTLWDISNAYLGTPWVWPSVWHENDTSIENPHLIHPGELIWITATEMRRVSREEADALIGAVPPETADATASAGDEGPVAEPPADDSGAGPAAVAPTAVTIDLPADIDSGSLSMPASAGAFEPGEATIHVTSRDTISFVSTESIEAASSIVEPPADRVWFGGGDVVQIGLGEGAVKPGDQLTVFRDEEPVRDMRGRLLGYHVEVLGWLEVKQVHPETSTAEVRVSTGEMTAGDRLVPREVLPPEIALHPAPAEFEGHVVHFPDFRTVAADGDFVYLDRGSIHGLEVGSQLEIYQGGGIRREEVHRTRVATAPRPVASLVVVSVKPECSVALVSSATTEIERGADVRAAPRSVASLH